MKTLVLVCVSYDVKDGADIGSYTADCVMSTDADCQLSGLKILSHNAPFAAEIAFTPGPNTSQKLTEQLRGFKGDWAILPAENRKKSLMLCDMDSTIIAQECLDELAQFAGVRDKVSALTEKAMAGEIDFEESLKTRVAMLKGLPLFAIDACYDNRIKFNIGANALVNTMRKHGAMCALVSSGFTDFAKRVAEDVGFNAFVANTLVNDGTVLTGEVGDPILDSQAKVDGLYSLAKSRNLELSQTLCIGDGANDVDMIVAAGLGLAYGTKSVVVRKANAAIRYTDLTAALFFQGYHEDEFAKPEPR